MELDNKIHPLLFGSVLKEQPFEIWMRFMFKQVEGKSFIKEELHKTIFNSFQSIYDLDEDYTFTNINMPPRSGKTASACYFLVYSIVNHVDCKFIYLSYSASLLNETADGILKIFNSKIFKILYGDLNTTDDILEVSFVNEYWKDYFKEVEVKTKNKQNSRLIKIGGSQIMLSPVGSQITGFGAGVRNATYFAGAIIMDDIEKIQDTINSEVVRNKVQSYFHEVILSRRNNPKCPIINIQQRICVYDMSGYLQDKYSFKSIKAPLFIDGVCQLPSQYDSKTLEMIQRNNTTFLSQYQQEPVNLDGELFNLKWFDFTDIPNLNKYENIYATIDTAFNDKEASDFTVVSVFGVIENKLYVINVLREKIKSIHLPTKIEAFLNEYKQYNLHYCWIENKASGITLLQGFKEYSSFIKTPKEEETKEYMKRDKNKFARAQEVIPYINDVNHNIIFNEKIYCLNDLKNELIAFPNSLNDDFVDTFIDGIRLFERYYIRRVKDYQTAINLYNRSFNV